VPKLGRAKEDDMEIVKSIPTAMKKNVSDIGNKGDGDSR
jgi:hypothetical protein